MIFSTQINFKTFLNVFISWLFIFSVWKKWNPLQIITFYILICDYIIAVKFVQCDSSSMQCQPTYKVIPKCSLGSILSVIVITIKKTTV
jgi:uncharacterized membrane protein